MGHFGMELLLGLYSTLVPLQQGDVAMLSEPYCKYCYWGTVANTSWVHMADRQYD